MIFGAPVSLARNSAAAEKRGRAKIHSPQPPFFLPARALDFVPAALCAAIKSFSEIFDKMNSSQTVKTHFQRFSNQVCKYTHSASQKWF